MFHIFESCIKRTVVWLWQNQPKKEKYTLASIPTLHSMADSFPIDRQIKHTDSLICNAINIILTDHIVAITVHQWLTVTIALVDLAIKQTPSISSEHNTDIRTTGVSLNSVILFSLNVFGAFVL